MDVTGVAAQAAPSLELSTGIAVAFPRSPMVAAGLAWELAENIAGRFRLGLGSQVKAHVERRYGAAYEPPGPRLRDYVLAVKACLAAFRGEAPLDHRGPYYRLSLLPPAWAPGNATPTATSRWISLPWRPGCAAWPARLPTVSTSTPSIRRSICGTGCCRTSPAVPRGRPRFRRGVDLIVPVFAIPGDTPEERAPLLERARGQIAFYGSTRNYAFQFDDLGFEGTSARLNERLKAGDLPGMAGVITDEMLAYFSVVARWDEMADPWSSATAGSPTGW